MQNKWQFPSTFAEVDGCYIPMKCPRGGNEERKEYYKFKNFYFTVMMRIVGTDHKFFVLLFNYQVVRTTYVLFRLLVYIKTQDVMTSYLK